MKSGYFWILFILPITVCATVSDEKAVEVIFSRSSQAMIVKIGNIDQEARKLYYHLKKVTSREYQAINDPNSKAVVGDGISCFNNSEVYQCSFFVDAHGKTISDGLIGYELSPVN